MSDKDFMNKYDDSDAVAFIRNYLPIELKTKFSEDDIYYILDVSEDYYEQISFFVESEDDEAEERELVKYIVEEAKKDKVGNFSPEDILPVLRGEEAYFESIYGDKSK